MPFFILFFVLVGIPLIELYFLIEVGSVIGALPTIALSILTAAIGASLVRIQGIGVLMRVQAATARGEMPAYEIIDGALLVIAGFVLLLPGFVTDVLGFMLLVPPARGLLIRRFVRVYTPYPPPPPSSPGDSEPRVLEGDYKRHD